VAINGEIAFLLSDGIFFLAGNWPAFFVNPIASFQLLFFPTFPLLWNFVVHFQ